MNYHYVKIYHPHQEAVTEEQQKILFGYIIGLMLGEFIKPEDLSGELLSRRVENVFDPEYVVIGGDVHNMSLFRFVMEEIKDKTVIIFYLGKPIENKFDSDAVKEIENRLGFILRPMIRNIEDVNDRENQNMLTSNLRSNALFIIGRGDEATVSSFDAAFKRIKSPVINVIK